MAKKSSTTTAASKGTVTTEPSFRALAAKAIKQRSEIVYLWDCRMGIPNGNSDNGNACRMDDSTGHGIATAGFLARRMRDHVIHRTNVGQLDPEFYDIYVKPRGILNDEHRKGYKAIGLTLTATDGAPKANKDEESFLDRVARWMCQRHYDVRTRGGVMCTGIPVRELRGPVQFMMSYSYNPIEEWDLPISRVAVTTRKEKAEGKDHMLGRMTTQPYALFCTHIYISALIAARTGFSDVDLEVLLDALEFMFEHDHSAASGEKNCRGIYLFKHAAALGNARAKDLVSRIKVTLDDPTKPIRNFDDYTVHVDRENLPDGVELIERAIG